MAALIASVSLAASSQASVIGLRFASKKPGTNTAMTLHIRYTKPGDPNAKPSPIRRIQIDAPAGTVFHSSRVPACEASDAEVMAAGPSACPSDSQIADGTIVVITGFGPPFDPFASPTPVFNDGRGWLEVSQTPSAPTTIAVTRLAVRGSRISGDIAASPGGPPDNQSAVSTVDLSFPASTRYITTPPRCPGARRWVTTGTFTFADGRTEVVRGDTACTTALPSEVRARRRPSRCAGRRATMVGTAGPDRLKGTPRSDVIVSLGGKDRISGRGGNDRICAGAGKDKLLGGAGKDRLDGGAGADRLSGGRGNDRLSGGRGNDRLSGNPGRDRLRGGPGRDRLFGRAGGDRLIGGPGNDRLYGGAGRDRLLGGRGRDRQTQ